MVVGRERRTVRDVGEAIGRRLRGLEIGHRGIVTSAIGSARIGGRSWGLLLGSGRGWLTIYKERTYSYFEALTSCRNPAQRYSATSHRETFCRRKETWKKEGDC